jgi:DsbC/DsbD-like thiol-disulfide interchange protein
MRSAALVILLYSTLFAQATPSLSFRGAKRPLHAAVTAGPENLAVAPGAKAMLFVNVSPNPNIHVYAPGARDYIPISVKLEPQPRVKAGKLTYPKSEVVTLLDERVPVFQKPFRLTQEVTLSGAKAGDTVPIKATVEWQACDDKVCYPPESAELAWTVTVK